MTKLKPSEYLLKVRREWGGDRAALFLFVGLLLLAWTVFAVVWVLATRVPERPAAVGASATTSTPVVVEAALVAEPIVAVMIDMHRDAHPISGVDRAPIVYEVPVEGGINRLLALFAAHDVVPEVGPVRSARPYFVDIASEYGAMYMHVGGSPDAVKKLRKRDDVVDVDEWYNTQFYWRDRRRASPHHIYTSTTRWLVAVKEREVASSTFGSWYFNEEAPSGWRPAPEMSIRSVNNGSAAWRWRDDGYVRWFGNDAYRTRAGDAISVNTIIVQQVAQRVLDAEGRLALDLRSEGFAWVFRDGVMLRGFWKYSEKEHRTRWYDGQGFEIPLKPGRLWVHVVPVGVEPVVSAPVE
ncbi:MAG: DUF3048 domain-containing protein [Patescibacteria group bacterium]